MKVKLIFCSMITGLVLLSSAAFANMNMSVDDKVNQMKTNLNLTDNQVNEVRPIIQDFKDKMDQIVKEKELKLSAILTPDQVSKMQSMKNDRDSK